MNGSIATRTGHSVTSAVPTTYQGSYEPLRATLVSGAFDSALRLSFDVRGGLLIRQMHHWSANLFMAAIVLHLLRIFFTGVFRKPRELNWLIGLSMFWLGFLEGFAGYSLPDDGLSGTGLTLLFESFGYKEGIPLDADWVIDARMLPNPHYEPVAGQELRDLNAVGPELRGTLREHVGIADVESVVEVGLQEPFLQRRLIERDVGLLGPPQQSVGQPCVGTHGPVHAELQTFPSGHLSEAADDRLGLLVPPELAGVRLDDRCRRAGGCLRVELVRAVDDLDVDLVAQLVHGALEPALADVAPRADDVGPDLDSDLRQLAPALVHGAHPRVPAPPS